MKTTLQILIETRELISHPCHWVQGSYAIRKDGGLADYASDVAYAFCARGACKRATGSGNYQAEDLLNRVAREFDPSCNGISVYNDTHAHFEVLQVIDRAIQIAEQEAHA